MFPSASDNIVHHVLFTVPKMLTHASLGDKALVDMVGAEVLLSEMVGGDGMNLGGEDGHLGIVQHNPLSRARGAEQVDENYMLLG